MAREIEIVFLMADLSGYTALTEAHGAVEAARTVTRYLEMARAVLWPGARLVEQVGDEVLIASEAAEAAVRTALALRDAVEREPLFPALRAGLHAGPVIEQGGRYFGAALNLTARVAAHARAGQILCTGPVAERVGGLTDIACRPDQPVRFKNVAAPVQVYEVTAAGSARGDTDIDPVCRMQVAPGPAVARLQYEGRWYVFCSLACLRTFAAAPETYASP